MLFWHWLIIGFSLAAVEMLTPGLFYFLFLGISAILVGLALTLGLPLPTWAQILVFSVLSIAELALFRGPVQKRLGLGSSTSDGKSSYPHEMIGERAVVTEEILPGAAGRVELRGSPWSARSTAGDAMKVGEDCLVERIDGLTLWVRPK